jgi:hypothetical protein
MFLSRIVEWSTLGWIDSKHKRNPNYLWNPGHSQTYELTKDHVLCEWQTVHTPTVVKISLWPLGGDNVLARSTNSYSSTTPSRSGSQTATKPVVGAECRFKVAGLCQPTMSCSQAYRQGPHNVKGLRATLEVWQLWISIILLWGLLQVNLVVSSTMIQ